MYQKFLTLILFTLISGNVINFSLQNFDFYYVFAAEEDNQTLKEENQAPKADDKKVSVDANDNVKITLEGKDDDKDDQIKYDIVSDPSHGKLDNFDKSEGTVTYITDKDYSGDDKFKYKVIDDKGAESDAATVDINVKAVNQVPKADDKKVSVDANDNVKITLEGKDDDKDDQIKYDIVSDPSHGKLDNFDKSEGTVTYITDKDYSGDDKFKYKVIDDKGAESNVAIIELSIQSINQPSQELGNQPSQELGNQPSQELGNQPSQELGNQTTVEDVQNMGVDTINRSPEAYDQSLSMVANDKIEIMLVGNDPDNDPIEFAIVSNPSDASLDSFDMTKGTVTYVPETDYTGNDTFTFKAIDDKGEESNVATVNVDVRAVTTDMMINDSANQAPKVLDQNTSVDKNGKLNITLSGNDPDNDPIEFAIVSNPSDASLDSFDMTKGTVTYVPETDYTGNDTFTFKAIDDKGEESNVATVNVDVKEFNQTNQAPEALDQTISESNSSMYRYLAWSQGEEEDRFILFARSTDGGKTYSSPISLTGKIQSPVFNPAVSSSNNNVYVAWQGQSKLGNQDIFLRKSADYGSSFGDIENISNDPGGSGNPELAIVGNTTHVAWEGTTPGNNFIFYSKSDDGLNFESPQKLSNNNGISYEPEIKVKDVQGADSFTYKVTDDKGAESNIATVDVNVDSINQSPSESNGKSASIDSSDKMDIKLEGIDDDKDPIKYEIVSPPSDGSLHDFDPSTGAITYVPNENNGIDLSYHNYINGHDKILTENIDNGDKVSNSEKINDNPFSLKR